MAPPGTLTPELDRAIRQHEKGILAVLGEGAKPGAALGGGIPRVAERRRYGLSITQQGAAVSAQEGGSLPAAFRLRGELDDAALAATLARIVARHAPLRSRFELAHDPPLQEVQAEVPVAIGRADLSALPAEEREARLHALLAEQRAPSFDVANGPLFRFHLTRISEREHVLLVAFSSLVFDGWSFDILWNELRHGYAALARGEPWPFPDLAVEYADFVVWQKARLAEREQQLGDFWRERLKAELPPLPLRTERPRSRMPSPRGGSIPFELPRVLDARLRAMARAEEVTPQVTVLAGLYAFLYLAGGEERIVIGTPVAARLEPALEGMIGPCENLLLLPAHVDGRETFGAFVRRLRDECRSAHEHQEFPIERLQLRSSRSADGGRAPVFQVELSYQQVSQRDAPMGGLSLSQIELDSGAAANDLTFRMKDSGERIAGAIEYKADLYDRETVEHWGRCYVDLLKTAVAEPGRRVAELPLLASERGRVEAAGRLAAEHLPPWLGARVQAGASLRAVRVVDGGGKPRPFLTVGEVVVEMEEGAVATGLRACLTHDGRLHEVADEPRVNVASRRRQPPAAPVGDLENQLVGLFANLIGAADVGAEDDYFDLGGTSLGAVRLLAEVQQRFGIRLPLASLLTEGTPRGLARAIQREVPSNRCLVPLKPSSSGRFLFLIHDGDGETLLYRNLALRMPDWLGVYGVQPRRAGRVPMAHATVAAAAAHYVAEVVHVQPRGPYHLGGSCAGGVLAFEMARQMVAAGHEVVSLFLIDAASPTARKRAPLGGERAERLPAAPQSRGGPLSLLRVATGRLARAAASEWQSRRQKLGTVARHQLLSRVYREGHGWPGWVSPPSPRDILALTGRDLDPAPLRGVRPVLFRATAGQGADQPLAEILVDPGFDWRPWCTEPVSVVDVAGGHSSMLQEPHVSDLGARISELVSVARPNAQSMSDVGEAGGSSSQAADREGARADGIVVDAITVSYRTASLVIRSLVALAEEREHAAARHIQINAVIVDNSQEDAPVLRAAVEREGWGSWVTVIEAPRNGGFAYGNNIGFHHGWQRERVPDYFFLLNPDAAVRPNAVVALVDFLEQMPEAASAASRLEDIDGQVWPYAFRFPNLLGEAVDSFGVGPLHHLFGDHVVLQPMGDRPQPVDWFPGAAMMVRSEVIRQLGGMDEGYFLYFEETDFCLKLHRAGWTNWYVPASHVMHEAGQSTGVTGERAVGVRPPRYWYESRRRYFAKNHGLRYAALLDGTVVAGNAFHAAYQRVRGKASDRVPYLVRDVLRSSVLLPRNRLISPAEEFQPR